LIRKKKKRKFQAGHDTAIGRQGQWIPGETIAHDSSRSGAWFFLTKK
jgi:hypothetical protein